LRHETRVAGLVSDGPCCVNPMSGGSFATPQEGEMQEPGS
jgi:hypothetical protein